MARGPDYLAPISAHAFRVLRDVEDSHWWFDGMETITQRILSKVGLDEKADGSENSSRQSQERQILDAGCGTGRNLVFLKRYGSVTGLDHSVDALGHCLRRGFQQLVRGSVNRMPLADERFDLVTCFDVLITDGIDDASALAEFARVMRPGAHLFLRVAAYDWLRSNHDIEWSVRHRYIRSELISKLKNVNLEIQVISYANTWLFPVALLKRFLEKIGTGHSQRSDLKIGSQRSITSRLLQKVLSSEAPWIIKPGLPCGLSLVALARKPSQ